MSGTSATGGPVDFEGWYRRERPRLVAVLRRTGHATAEAEEAADEAMARALARWPRVSAMASPTGWATVVAFDLARRRGARARREPVLAAPLHPDDLGQASHDGHGDLDLWAAVGRLPPRQRDVVVLRYVVDLPEAEIGRLLRIRRGTVASCLSDARRSLARTLGPAGRAPTEEGAPRATRP